MKQLKVNKSDLFIVILYLYIFRNILIHYIPIFRYADEFLGVIGIIMFLLNKHKNVFKKDNKLIAFGLIIYILAGVMSYLLHRIQPLLSITLPDMFLDIKFWAWFYIGYKFSKKSYEHIINKLELHARFLICVLFVFTVIDLVFHLFNEMTDIKMGMRAIGLWDGPAALTSSACTLLVIIISKKSNKWISPFTIMVLLTILLTLRYKALATVAVYICFFLYQAGSLKRIKVYHIAILGVLAVFVARVQIITYINTRNINARSVLWIKSVTLAMKYFPFGTGPGTFASYYSRVQYSPVYSMLGINNIQGLRESNPNFISDTFWPMVIGQFGMIGLIGYVMSLYWLYKEINIHSLIDSNRYFSGIFILIYMMITSVAESTFLNWNAVMIAIILGIVLRKKQEVVQYETRTRYKRS